MYLILNLKNKYLKFKLELLVVKKTLSHSVEEANESLRKWHSRKRNAFGNPFVWTSNYTSNSTRLEDCKIFFEGIIVILDY